MKAAPAGLVGFVLALTMMTPMTMTTNEPRGGGVGRLRSFAGLKRCTECGAELSRWAFVLHRVPPELVGEAIAQPDSFGRACCPRLQFATLGIVRFDEDHDRWTAMHHTVSAAYQRALDDLANGHLTFWQRANLARIRIRA